MEQCKYLLNGEMGLEQCKIKKNLREENSKCECDSKDIVKCDLYHKVVIDASDYVLTTGNSIVEDEDSVSELERWYGESDADSVTEQFLAGKDYSRL